MSDDWTRSASARVRRWLPYVVAAAALFAAGTLVGAGLIAVADLDALASFGGGGSVFPDRLTTVTIFVNNLIAQGINVLGVISFGLASVVMLLFNGILLGLVAGGAVVGGNSLLRVVALIAPHGVLELPAFWLASGVSFRTTHRLVNYLRGADDRPPGRPEVVEAVAILLGSVVLLAVAAWIEATLTVEIARALT